MGILVAPRDGVGIHAVAAHFARERRQVLSGGYHVKLGSGERVSGGRRNQENDKNSFHENRSLKWMRSVGAHGKLKLKEQFVRGEPLAIARAAELSANLAELARPVGEQQ